MTGTSIAPTQPDTHDRDDGQGCSHGGQKKGGKRGAGLFKPDIAHGGGGSIDAHEVNSRRQQSLDPVSQQGQECPHHDAESKQGRQQG